MRFAMIVTAMLAAQGAYAQSPAELQQLEQGLDAEQALDEQASEEIIASSQGGEPLQPPTAPNHAERISENVLRAYGAALAVFATSQVLCFIPAVLKSDDPDLSQIGTWCGSLGLALGLGLAVPMWLRGEGSRGWAYVGSLLGTVTSFGLAFAPRVPLGVAAVSFAVLPVALALLTYELSDRAHRRRARYREHFSFEGSRIRAVWN